MRKRLATVGDRGQLVRLFVEQRGKVRRYVVQWGPKGQREQESFAYTKEGKAEAEAFFQAFGEELKRPAKRARVTNRALWAAFADAEGGSWRPRTAALYRDAWRKWEQHAGAQSIAEDTTVEQTAGFRKALDTAGLATATVRNIITAVRVVFNWGERTELIERNRWHLFVHKIAKDKRTKQRADYRAEEFLAIWGAMDPTRRGQWRPWVAVGLLGIYGNRQHEILNLRWEWITDAEIVVPMEYVKNGETLRLAIFPQTRRILDVARSWREREGYAGALVLFPGQTAAQRRHGNVSKLEHYSIQSLTLAIHRAEQAAGVPQIRWRAGHGFRRGLMGDLVDETGDVTLALQALGDRDLSMAQHYRVRRNDKVDAALQRRLDRLVHPESATKVQPNGAENDNDPEIGSLSGSGEA